MKERFIIMTIEKSNDKNYPYTIKGAWGDKVYCSLSDLKEIKKEINKILKETIDK
jgi:hypothetical protein